MRIGYVAIHMGQMSTRAGDSVRLRSLALETPLPVLSGILPTQAVKHEEEYSKGCTEDRVHIGEDGLLVGNAIGEG